MRPRRAPHPRGDGPARLVPAMASMACSPPAWGWSVVLGRMCKFCKVLPTRVGMVRTTPEAAKMPFSAPHPRGDGPVHCQCFSKVTGCSPPAWGWSAKAQLCLRMVAVLPTRVGMVRVRSSASTCRMSAPHPRGDGPSDHEAESVCLSCSPPAWGWSVETCSRTTIQKVLPTRVGMVRADN